MAVLALTNEYVLINSVNLSDHVKSATLKLDVNQLDTTGFGSSWTSFIGGLKSGTLSIEFMDDFAASNVDVTLWPILSSVVTFEVRPDAGARSTTNPGYTGSVLISQLAVGGQLGDLAMKSVSWPTSGTIARQTS